MRIPLSWLKEYVDITIPLEELAHRLTLAGLEVGSIDYIGLPCDVEASKKYAMPFSTDHLVWDREKVVIGHVVEVKPHPDADRLTLAMVESGVGEIETVVNGASNLVPYVGKGIIDPPLVVAYAREGAELLDPYADEWPQKRMTLKPKKLRGIMNKSMVCSQRELGVSEEHGGIMLLETDVPPGTPLQDVLGDIVLDIDLTPNLARCFSVLGVAREVAALTGQKVRYPSLDITATGTSIEGQAGIDIRVPELNPRFTLALIKGIELKPSPGWLKRRLVMAGMRPINNIVDITNYVMLEYGQPLHAFDYDILVKRAGGKAPTIITRTASPGEKLKTLDGVERGLDSFTELVADTAGALSIAGIMGGAESEVYDASSHLLDAKGVQMGTEESPATGKAEARPASTTSVLLESASWNFINLRQTLQAQRERGKEMSSEAGTRFSRGVHPAQAEYGLLRAIELMRQIAGGEIASGIVDSYPAPAPVVTVDLRLSEVQRILGISLSQDEVAAILEGLEFTTERKGTDALLVTVPDHRLDIGEINNEAHEDIRDLVAQADLIEEIARIYGYDNIPNTLIEDSLPPQHTNYELANEEMARDILAKAGLQEIITYRLTTPDREALLTPPGAVSSWPKSTYVEMANPVSQDKTVMRHTLLSGVLDTLGANLRWKERIAIFEIGKVYLPAKGQNLPDEPRRLAIAMTGKRESASWQDARSTDLPLMDFYDLKGVLELLVDGLHLDNINFSASDHTTFFPGRAADIMVNGRSAGTLGELHPLVRESLGLPEQPVLVAEIDLDILLLLVTDMHTVNPVANYPAIYQDIAVVVDESVPAADVEEVIMKAGGWLLRNLRLFDVYRGEQIGIGKKSLAYALTFQAFDKTLRDKDADRIRGKILKELQQALGAELRS